MRIFEPTELGGLRLSNRLVRSATFEGACDAQGSPTSEYERFYENLSQQGLGALITGFIFVSKDGRSMQPGQGGLDTDAKIPAFARISAAVHRNNNCIFAQLAHAGRQTTEAAVGGRVRGASRKRSWYFGSQPEPLSTEAATAVAEQFGAAAARARAAGFDGVQLHAAHGYLIHQFLHPGINDRRDLYGITSETGLGTRFLETVLSAVRRQAGFDFPILVKVSGGDNHLHRVSPDQFAAFIEFLDRQGVSGIEVSYGTMDYAMNIFRGSRLPVEVLLAHNPRFRTNVVWKRALYRWIVFPVLASRFRPFEPMYNLPMALLAKRHCRVPVIAVGGFRSGAHVREAIEERGVDFVGLSRALLCEPDFALRLRASADHVSACRNCNTCAVMCDSGRATRCYHPPRGNETRVLETADYEH